MLDFSDVPGCAGVFRFFEEFSAIPHGSGNTAGIASYLVKFAGERRLSCVRDEANNVLIRKPATPGKEASPVLILQGHTDMVAEKVPGSTLDMEKEGLKLYRDGDFLRAEGTTLGGDDGIAVAYMLAILDDDALPHPALECLFTSDEEIGLLGAAAFDTSLLTGHTLLNLDSEEEGIFTVGCAGGVRCDTTLPVRAGKVTGKAVTITLSGLCGGHSGTEIIRGGGNAILLMGELLCRLPGARLVSFRGGNADNAIPRECTMTVIGGGVAEMAETFFTEIKTRFGEKEPELAIRVASATVHAALSAEDTRLVATLLTSMPNGVQAMNPDIPGLVQTSLNAGIADFDSENFTLSASVRSSVGAEKDALVRRLEDAAHAVGATFGTRGAYPAWEYRKDSALREGLCRTYRKMYGRDAACVVIHAGLECGIFAGKIADFDAVSFGPDNHDIHTTEEHLSLSSSARVYDFLRTFLAQA